MLINWKKISTSSQGRRQVQRSIKWTWQTDYEVRSGIYTFKLFVYQSLISIKVEGGNINKSIKYKSTGRQLGTELLIAGVFGELLTILKIIKDGICIVPRDFPDDIVAN